MIQSQIITGMEWKDRKSEYQPVYRDNVTRLGTPFFHEMDADQKHKNIN